MPLRRSGTEPARTGVYVHIPFCAARCDYCDFATWTDRAHLLHPLLPRLLLLEQLPLAADVAAVAFGGHVFADSGNRFASDDACAQCGLNRDFELMA